MTTHGHREGNITYWGLFRSEGLGRGSRGGGNRRGIILGEMPNVDDRVMDTANHYGTCIPM